MKIVQFTQPGPPEVLKYIDAPMPEPKAGEVVVRSNSIGVGMPDTRIRAGTYRWMPSLPCIPGTEMSGVVEKVGPGVTSRKVGDRVVVSARERSQRGGCYAEFIATPADGTYVLPTHVSSTRRQALPTIRLPITCCATGRGRDGAIGCSPMARRAVWAAR